jgi:hypothetical protein
MIKYTYLIIVLIVASSCKKDKDETVVPIHTFNEMETSAKVNGVSLIIPQLGNTSFARINGKIIISTSNTKQADEGFVIYLGENPKVGQYLMADSVLAMEYRKDKSSGIVYNNENGNLFIDECDANSIATLKLQARFDGWFYNRQNAQDSIYIREGKINLEKK